MINFGFLKANFEEEQENSWGKSGNPLYQVTQKKFKYIMVWKTQKITV
jgi:hypothetical protein